MNANDCAATIQGKWKKNTEYTLRMKPAVHGEGKPGEGERVGGGGWGGNFNLPISQKRTVRPKLGGVTFYLFLNIFGGWNQQLIAHRGGLKCGYDGTSRMSRNCIFGSLHTLYKPCQSAFRYDQGKARFFYRKSRHFVPAITRPCSSRGDYGVKLSTRDTSLFEISYLSFVLN